MEPEEVTGVRRFAGGIAVVGIMVLRGGMMWVIIPLAYLSWLPLGLFLRRRGITFGHYLGWIDLNFICLMQRTIFRPLTLVRLDWTPWSGLASVDHRVRWGYF